MLPLKVLAVQIGCAYAMWIFGKFACKVNIQEVAFALPITFIMPATVSGIAGKATYFTQSALQYNFRYFQGCVTREWKILAYSMQHIWAISFFSVLIMTMVHGLELKVRSIGVFGFCPLYGFVVTFGSLNPRDWPQLNKCLAHPTTQAFFWNKILH